MICSKCGKNIPDGAKFCGWCGARCGEKVCAACGTKLRSDQLFCHECGVKWNGNVSLAAERTVPNTAASAGMNISSGGAPGRAVSGQSLQKLTICRLRQNAGSDSWDCRVRALDEWRVIKAGETWSYNVFTDSVQVEIMYFKGDSQIAPGGVRMQITLAQIHDAELSFGMSGQAAFRDGNTRNEYPQIDKTIRGAVIVQQKQDMFVKS